MATSQLGCRVEKVFGTCYLRKTNCGRYRSWGACPKTPDYSDIAWLVKSRLLQVRAHTLRCSGFERCLLKAHSAVETSPTRLPRSQSTPPDTTHPPRYHTPAKYPVAAPRATPPSALTAPTAPA